MGRWPKLHRIAAFAAAFVVLAPARAWAQDSFRGKVEEIVNGAEIRVRVESWSVSVRLHGVSAPLRNVTRPRAVEYLRRRIGVYPVRVQVRGTAPRGVVYGDVFPEGARKPVNVELVAAGLGTWAAEYAPDREDIASAQLAAQRGARGMWGSPLDNPMPRFNAPTPPPVRPTPKPRASAKPPASPIRRSVSPLKPFAPVFAAVFAGMLGAAALIATPVRRLSRRRTLAIDAAPGPIKLRGVAVPMGRRPRSAVGQIAALYLHETAWRYTGNRWQLVRDDREAIAFTVDDGSGPVEISGDECEFHAVRAARFYNDVPVEKWHEVPYPGDSRTEILFVPAGAVVTVVGEYAPDPPRVTAGGAMPRVVVVEGDERRLFRRAGTASLALGFAAVASAIAFFFAVNG